MARLRKHHGLDTEVDTTCTTVTETIQLHQLFLDDNVFILQADISQKVSSQVKFTSVVICKLLLDESILMVTDGNRVLLWNVGG